MEIIFQLESGPLVTQIRLDCTLLLEPPHHQLGHPIQQQDNHTGLYSVDAVDALQRSDTRKKRVSLL